MRLLRRLVGDMSIELVKKALEMLEFNLTPWENKENVVLVLRAAIEQAEIHTCHADCQRFACVQTRKAVEAEREACAQVCEEECADPDDQFKNYEDTHTDGWQDGCNSCAWAIRARGQA